MKLNVAFEMNDGNDESFKHNDEILMQRRWCRRDWSSPPDARAQEASRRVLYSQVFLGSPEKCKEKCLSQHNQQATSFILKSQFAIKMKTFPSTCAHINSSLMPRNEAGKKLKPISEEKKEKHGEIIMKSNLEGKRKKK
ncbi:CLUMA_CG019197, isoform A [Clunio marinus]|uniref:CLUMA_CG019197, isoform A n=1 Tax=Clunio marinus TaxID=568069 RepID=A0A1J1J0Z6_9DIPT|nr:CLUMA_CG019197, isoform A [Clunio marinus]